MELGQDKQQTITRLAICVVIAVMLYAALDKLGGGIPKLAPYKPWLEQNRPSLSLRRCCSAPLWRRSPWRSLLPRPPQPARRTPAQGLKGPVICRKANHRPSACRPSDLIKKLEFGYFNHAIFAV